MTQSSSSTLFLRWFTISVMTGIATMVAFVVIVDPYDQYRIVVSPGFNFIKPGLTRYQSEIKLTHAAKLRADALIFGNSRGEAGLDPEAPVFAKHGLSAYNLAIPGSGIATARKQAEYLHQIGVKPTIIILGLEFLDFLDAPKAARSVVSHAVADENRHPVTQWFWRFDSLFSLASVKDAIRTLRLQYDGEAEMMTSRGFNPLREYESIVRSEGYFNMFRQRAQENARIYLGKAEGLLSIADFGHLRVIVGIAAESGSDVALIIYPYHAQIFALFEETGLVRSFDEWKSILAREVSAARLRHPEIRISLFDFSGYSSYNCEKIPAKGDRAAATQWYWEAGHFKKHLGDVVLESIFFRSTNPLIIVTAEPEMPGKFGFQLEESNMSLNARRIQLERSECMRNYPELFAEVAALVADERSRKQTAH